jgi:hypothetical protein
VMYCASSLWRDGEKSWGPKDQGDRDVTDLTVTGNRPEALQQIRQAYAHKQAPRTHIAWTGSLRFRLSLLGTQPAFGTTKVNSLIALLKTEDRRHHAARGKSAGPCDSRAIRYSLIASAFSPPMSTRLGSHIAVLGAANRTTNANMLSPCCEFLKLPQGRWFQRFG